MPRIEHIGLAARAQAAQVARHLRGVEDEHGVAGPHGQIGQGAVVLAGGLHADAAARRQRLEPGLDGRGGVGNARDRRVQGGRIGARDVQPLAIDIHADARRGHGGEGDLHD
jgi:hypothetical protein